MKNPLFSIVIPTYNRAELLKRCIQSVIDQTYPNWEAIVVDNFSEDNTEEVVTSFNDYRIQYIKNHNYGIISVSRNIALDLAKGDWICFLDSDDAWFSNKLETVLQYTQDYDFIYHGIKMDIQKQHFYQHTCNYFYEIRENTVNYVIQRGDPILPSCACLSSKILGNTRFDVSPEFKAVEDYEFFLEIIDKRPRIKYLKKALTLYDMSGCSHAKDVAERDISIYRHWQDSLNDKESKEVLLTIESRLGWHYLGVGDYDNAIIHFSKAAKSKILGKRFSALKQYYKCKLLKLLK